MYRWRLIVKRIPVYKGQNNWKLSHSTKMLIMANLKNAQEKKRSSIIYMVQWQQINY